LLLHLRVLLDLQSSPTVLPSLLSTPVETMLPQRRILSQIPSGGGGGIRTPVQESFALKGLQQFFT